MDLTPKSYMTASPHYSSAFRPHPTLNNSIYATPPQSRGHSDGISAHSPAISGLGIVNCGLPSSSAQLPIGSSSQSLVPLTQCWPSEPTSSGCFSNTSLSYPPLSLYDDLDALSATGTSPFPVASSHSEAPNHLAFYNSQQHTRSSNMDLQRASVFDHYDLSERANLVPRAQQRVPAQFTPSVTRCTPKRSFQDGQLSYQTPVISVPSNFHRGPSGILLDLDTNFSNQTMQSRAQRNPLCSSNFGAPSGVNSSTTNSNEGVKKPARKRTTTATAKYQCDKCGMSFTRNSNCKSHMKIHDPNRKYPHKCTHGNCTKKFSRKTDLIRHVDSVSSLDLFSVDCLLTSKFIGS